MLICVLISALAEPRQTMWLEAIEKRVDITAQVLRSVKDLRMTGLTDQLYLIIQAMRDHEVTMSEKFRRLLILVVGVGKHFIEKFRLYHSTDYILAYSNVSVTPLAAFLIYSLNARGNSPEDTLTPARAFTSLTLFTLLSTPISTLVEAVTGIATGIGSLKRINLFLQSPLRGDDAQVREVESRISSRSTVAVTDEAQPPIKESKVEEKQVQILPSNSSREMLQMRRTPSNSSREILQGYDALVTLDFLAQNVSTGWEEDKPFVIKDATFEIHHGTLNMIVGPVGCGKSTFVRMLLRETPIVTGELLAEPGAIAYCSQNPWLTNSTMQENILGESLFDLNWYNIVVHACALEEDIRFMPNRDQGLLGSAGASLSGGQKQRVVSTKYLIRINTYIGGLHLTILLSI